MYRSRKVKLHLTVAILCEAKVLFFNNLNVAMITKIIKEMTGVR